MNLLQPIFYIPVILFLVIALTMYFLESDTTKRNTMSFIGIRVILPAIVVALLSFVIIKYRDSSLFSQEKMMKGNYFDLPNENIN